MSGFGEGLIGAEAGYLSVAADGEDKASLGEAHDMARRRHGLAVRICDDLRANGCDERRYRDAVNVGVGQDAHQNSIPGCAFTPERNGCLISTISVTRSAISISSSLALRPVTMTWVSRGLFFSTA